MYETRQNMEKVSRRIETGGGGTRQRMKMNNKRILRVQLKPSIAILQTKNDLKCHTTILYVSNGNGIFSSSAYGMNDPDNRIEVVNKIKKYPQTKDLKVDQMAPKSNRPGQCAEPHSLANALEQLKQTDKIIEITQGPAIVIKDYYDYRKKERLNRLVFNDLKTEFGYNSYQFWREVNERKKLQARNKGERVFGKDKNIGDAYPPCNTCKLWLPQLPDIGKKGKEEYYNNISANEYSSESDRYERYPVPTDL